MTKETEKHTTGELSDGELVHAYINGDEKAFETLYYRYRKPLYGFLNSLSGNNTSEADEVFAETWLRVIDKLPKYHDSGKFSAWLFRISRNIFIDRLRHSKPDRFVVINDDISETADSEFAREYKTDNLELGNIINAALDQLHPEQKEVFLLREEAELSFREIAEIQNCSLGTVLSRMRYALKKLRSFLQNIDSGGLLK